MCSPAKVGVAQADMQQNAEVVVPPS
jgi:hypothetical protein